MHVDLPSPLLLELPERLGHVGPRFLAVPCRDRLLLYVLREERFGVWMLVEYFEEGSSVRDVDIFRWLAVVEPSGVGVEVGLSPFEGEVGLRSWGKSGGKNGQDAGVPVQAGAHEVEEDGLDWSFTAGGWCRHRWIWFLFVESCYVH